VKQYTACAWPWAGGQVSWISIPDKQFWGPPSLLVKEYRDSVPGVKVAGAWSYTTASPHAFVTWFLMNHRDNVIFLPAALHTFFLSFLYPNLLHQNWKQLTSALQIRCYQLNFYIIAYSTTYLLLKRSVVYIAMFTAYHVFKFAWCLYT